MITPIKEYEPETWMDRTFPNPLRQAREEREAIEKFSFHTFYRVSNPVIGTCKKCGYRGCVGDPMVGILDI